MKSSAKRTRFGLGACASLAIFFFLAGCEKTGAPSTQPEKPAAGGSEIVVPWLDGAVLRGEAEPIKRFGRFERNALWDRIELLATRCLETPSKKLHMYGEWFMGRVKGRRLIAQEYQGDAERERLTADALQHLKKAVELGFTNPQPFREAKELYALRDLDEFENLVTKLEADAEERIRESYKNSVNKELEVIDRVDLEAWTPEVKTPSGKRVLQEGQPMAVIVSRIHHDGLNKLFPALQWVAENSSVPVGLLFHQLTLEDSERIEQTEKYVGEWQERIHSAFPWGVIDEKAFNQLHSLLRERHAKIEDLLQGEGATAKGFRFFEPVIVFLDGKGTPVLHENGVLRDWQLEHTFGEIENLLEADESSAKPEGDERAEDAPAEGDTDSPVKSARDAESAAVPGSESKGAAVTPPDAGDAGASDADDARASDTGDAGAPDAGDAPPEKEGAGSGEAGDPPGAGDSASDSASPN